MAVHLTKRMTLLFVSISIITGKTSLIYNVHNLSKVNINKRVKDPMKHIVKIMALLVALSAFWISLLQTSVIPDSYTWLLPLYFIVSLGCYGLLMIGVGLMRFPTCPNEAILLQQDIIEAKEFLKGKGVDVD